MPGMKLRWMSFGSGGRAGGWRGEAWTCTNLSQMDLFPIFAKTTVCRLRRRCLPSLPSISTLWLDVVVIYIQSKIVHGHNSRKWAGRKHGMATTKCFGLRMAFCSVPFRSYSLPPDDTTMGGWLLWMDLGCVCGTWNGSASSLVKSSEPQLFSCSKFKKGNHKIVKWKCPFVLPPAHNLKLSQKVLLSKLLIFNFLRENLFLLNHAS